MMLRKGAASFAALTWMFTTTHTFCFTLPRIAVAGIGSMDSRKAFMQTRGLSSLAESTKAEESTTGARKTPVTIISGFLGAGKTTFLETILKKEHGKKFGLVVNDVAAVNVDSKLIKKRTNDEFDGVDTLELENGCVCCSLADDLMVSVAKLVTMARTTGKSYDHIIVECSGIAEPRKMREIFQEAQDYQSPLCDWIDLDTLLTVVDAKSFLDLFGTDVNIVTNLHLAANPGDAYGEQIMNDGSGMRKVTELLLEQVECADIVLINKCDLLKNSLEIDAVKNVIVNVNPLAKVHTCVKGGIEDPISMLGCMGGEGAASWGVLDEHRAMLEVADRSSRAVENSVKEKEDLSTHDHDHSHSHSHAHGEISATECAPGCNDPTHNHDHSHDHSHGSASACAPGCNDPTHDHSHDSHSHSHDHNHEATTAEERFGITSFVYRRRRPFHPQRFSLFLQGLGDLSVNGLDDVMATVSSGEAGEKYASQLQGAKANLLRSKGFVWMATSAQAGYFVSHAGQFLELMILGRWWADIARSDWPEGQEDEIMIDFDGDHGDRRQEIVFIGLFDETSSEAGTNSKKSLEEVLDTCLLTDEEMAQYVATTGLGDEALRKLWFP